ncbi:MAG: glycine--tRNA ligase subunit alpha, partial [Chlamydiae bacterium]|nr:glycine--tRNA ligase subunit alpha [Chlamydiota bacterium]
MQTAHLQQTMGTPRELPVPKNRNLPSNIALTLEYQGADSTLFCFPFPQKPHIVYSSHKTNGVFFMRSEALTFQQIIQRLTEFWEKQGCVVHQGYDVEVGAGTFNPATFLRCLGPEPYNTVFVEPSRRPTDGRYGENPNRVQLFHQLQVLMKPSPSDIQQLYLRSLEALGLDLTVHDIRFVHDDWESPTLGAWGLGWEVWCDGMEITQFTYFQAAGSLSLSPISVELAYGLERLAMFIQNVDNLFMVRWNDKLTFADISHQAEVEWSRYNFEEATTAMWHRHFEDYEKEVARLIEKKLPFPAYDFVLKTSHAFNMLDARGAISVTERTGYITRIRDLARKVAEGFVASREAKQFPLLSKKEPMKEPELPLCPSTFQEGKKRDFLLEIGSEQLPASFVPMGMRGLEAIFRSFLQEHGLTYSSLSVYGTPQRLAILIQDLPEGTKARQQEKKGPPVTTAFDTTGYLSPLGEGFIRSLGLTSSCSREELVAGRVDDLTIKEVKGTEYLFYLQKEPALSTMSLLSKELARLILQVDFPKKMRWGSGQVAYARPLRWLLALFGEEVIPFVLGNLTSCRHSMGHAQRKHIPIPIKTPTEYLNSLREHFVLADPYERKEHILQQIRSIEKQKQCSALAVDRVLPQVLYLTEWPEVTVGSFQETFLQAPAEVLISEMVEHQKYFPLADGQGHLCNAFLITADNTPSPLVVHGNERVLSARLSDGVFLYKQDVRTPLTQFNEKLK